MNLHKEAWAFGDFLGIGNDLGWYSTQWFAFNNYQYGFLSIFDEDYAIFINDGFLVQPKISEPIYHGYSYFFSKLTNGNYIFYTYTITLFIYLPACIVIYKILDSAKFSEVLIALALMFFIFYSMKFTNMFNMIRHYCSGSFLIITLFFLYFDKIRFAIFFGVIASLTHNAAVVVCAIYFVVYYVTASDERSNRYKILYVVMGSAAISILYLLVYYATFTNYEELDDRGSGILFKLLDVAIVLLSIFAYMVRRKSTFDKMWFYYIGIIVLICFMHTTNFLQLRYYAYFDYFRWIGLVYIFSLILRVVRLKLLFFSLSLIAFILFLWYRIYISDFDFNGMFHHYFFIKF
ncbi:hypothetical protein PNI02_14410 [Pseudoalteromonas nigrifaciens]|nr:hypothetical protein PNI02_14410 [Pseudoalteromonas nigrifaciens]